MPFAIIRIIPKRARPSGFLMRLLADRRGNVLAILAAALIPVLGLAGSAIDVARTYAVKARLQQACDAGVLAGRKYMTIASTSAILEPAARDQAKAFFRNNFPDGWLGTGNTTFTPAKANESDVSGNAATTVPMTVMGFFGAKDAVVNVSCAARYDVSDTDVLFVLDVTGSMACPPTMANMDCGNFTDSQGDASRYTRPGSDGIANYSIPAGYPGTTGLSVREAADSRVAALRKAVLAFYDTFAANADASTHVRYGFVPYSSSVNVGQAILDVSPGFLVGSGGSLDRPHYQTRYVAAADAGTPGPVWTYDRQPVDVSPLVAGRTMKDPTKTGGEAVKWTGCIESATSSPGSADFSTLPPEIDPDLKPTGAQRWWPHLPTIEYRRPAMGPGQSIGEQDVSPKGRFWNFDTLSSSDPNFQDVTTCPKPVKRLGVMTRDDVSRYINAVDFAPMGGTYHDIGMIWGGRLMSPGGPWSADTAAWPGRNTPNRVIIFLTDGVMAPQTKFYSMYGQEALDKRIGPGKNGGTLTYLHEQRFLAACQAAKSRNIQIWTVAIATGAVATMQQCATTADKALTTTSGPDLSEKFKIIAEHIATLRSAQ